MNRDWAKRDDYEDEPNPFEDEPNPFDAPPPAPLKPEPKPQQGPCMFCNGTKISGYKTVTSAFNREQYNVVIACACTKQPDHDTHTKRRKRK